MVAEALTDTLDSNDAQQRYFAAHVLMQARLKRPPERLLLVAIDMMANGKLKDTSWAMAQIWCYQASPQGASIRYMLQYAQKGEQHLLGYLYLLMERHVFTF